MRTPTIAAIMHGTSAQIGSRMKRRNIMANKVGRLTGMALPLKALVIDL